MSVNRKARDSNLQIVLVAGPPRSGTTLLAGILSGGQAYPQLPECSYITHVVNLAQRVREYEDPERARAFFGGAEERLDAYRASIDVMIANAVRSTNVEPRRYLVLKDPELTICVPDALMLMPHAKVVCCIRDPRDTVSSLMDVRRRAGEDASAARAAAELYPYFAAIPLVEEIGGLVVRFEDIVRGDRRTFESLDTFLGYKVAREAYLETAVHFDRSNPFFVETYGASADASRIGSFRKSLSRTDLAQVEHMYASPIYRYGYA